MRLLDVQNPMEMKEFIGSNIPPYAILSHTWEEDEITLQQAKDPGSVNKQGYRKIQQTCALAAQQGLAYAWVDTCCIDKSSSAELTEATNSMYQWYENAQVCYVYLPDLEPTSPLDEALKNCRWFTRGWTLQELIAPRNVTFYDKEWRYRGCKSDLSRLITSITGIPESILDNDARPSDYAIARRMSWAARRETTRIEDMAYCLLGLFDVNLTLIYGEGAKAFLRLQEAIVQTGADLSIFAWTDDRVPCPDFACVLAESPRQFAKCGNFDTMLGDSAYFHFFISGRGIQVEASLCHHDHDPRLRALMDIYSSTGDSVAVAISLRKIGGNLYVRYKPGQLAIISSDMKRGLVEPITLATRLRPRIPFSPWSDPVLGNRHSALRFSWAEGSPGFQSSGCRYFPNSHWDMHDSVFFGPNTKTKGWAVCFVKGHVSVESGVRLPVSFLLASFMWNRRPHRAVIANLASVSEATAVFLENQLAGLPFEGCGQVEKLVRGAFGDGAVGESITVHATIDDSGTECDGDMCVARSTMPKIRAVTATLGFTHELHRDVCLNPLLCVNLVIRSA